MGIKERERGSERLRNWLDRNEVYFRVLGGVLVVALLGLAAVLVAHQANLIADQQTHLVEIQTSIAERQTSLMEAELLPFLRLTHQLRPREEPDDDEEDIWILVHNTGGPFDDLEITARSFLRAAGSSDSRVAGLYWPLLYLNGDHLITDDTQGVIAVLTARTYDVSWTNWCSGGNSGPFVLEFYVTVSYTDRLRGRHKEIFRLVVDWRYGRNKGVECQLMREEQPPLDGSLVLTSRVLQTIGIPGSLAGAVVDVGGLEPPDDDLICVCWQLELEDQAYQLDMVCLGSASKEGFVSASERRPGIWIASPMKDF
ncbi:hypothetical protein ACFLTM_03335 [Candidatus Bipolaricaulota bacterium]